MFNSGYRKQRKAAQELLRNALHIRNMREDILPAEDLQSLDAAARELDQALSGRERDPERLSRCSGVLLTVVDRLTPPKWRSSIRENLEVMMVAIAVAMAFRAYLMQPFKIPTGSMQPTLYGIHSVTHEAPTVFDRYPLNLVKLAVTGSWYSERYAVSGGTMPHRMEEDDSDQSIAFIRIGGVMHKLPKDAVHRGEFFVSPGREVRPGDLLWSGNVIRGDHLFVNKLLWNFRKPHRGEVSVFETSGIAALPPGTHYIKRLIALPGEQVGIVPPDVLIDGTPLDAPEGIMRIARQDPGYDGFQLVDMRGILRQPSDRLQLGPHEYFTLGDNTHNSFDGRYWGTVPAANMVGPAAFVYWPVSSRWGRRIR